MIAAGGSSKRGDLVASLNRVWKYYGPFAALKDVSLDLRRGEVHMLLGENGAGKSTLVGLLIGSHAPDKGTVSINGAPARDYSPVEARRQGINAVLQDFSLAPSLTVAENYFLGREVTHGGLLNKAVMRRTAAAAVGKLGIQLDADRRVSELSRAEQQVLEIVRALGGEPGALVLDEPTATLSHDESEHLFAIVKQLREEGWGILYITHRLEEVPRLGDRVTVLRDGQVAGAHELSSVSEGELVQEMIGRPLTTFYPTVQAHPTEAALSLIDITTADGGLDRVTLEIRRGEIVGIGGLVGCGKGDVARAIFGLVPIRSGRIEQDGRAFVPHRPRDALHQGIVYLPQDRRREALALNRSMMENLTFEVVGDRQFNRLGLLRRRSLSKLAGEIAARLDIRPRDTRKRVQELSGGNQQKVVLGRALTRERLVYVFDEPAAGIDVAARVDFYNQIKGLCEAGAAILLITSDLQELVHLSHRVYVMHAGRIAAELAGERITEEAVVRHSFGEAAEAA